MLTLWAYNMVGHLYKGNSVITIPYKRWWVVAYPFGSGVAPIAGWPPSYIDIKAPISLDISGMVGSLWIQAQSDFYYDSLDGRTRVANSWAFPRVPPEPYMVFPSGDYGLNGEALEEFQVHGSTSKQRLTQGIPPIVGPGGEPSGGAGKLLLIGGALALGVVLLAVTRHK